MIARRAFRALVLCATLAACLIRYGIARLRGPSSLAQRARWLQKSCRAVLRSIHIQLCVVGAPPEAGIVVSNHLSYLDIAALGAVRPFCFVSKAEVRSWPLFGVIARAGGTIFLNRSRLASASQAASQITGRFEDGVPVVLFPEGTTSNGSSVLRFHSLLLQSAVQAGMPVTATSIRYHPTPCIHERDVCWFGNAKFLPHLWRTLGVESLTVEIQFGAPHIYHDRRTAAMRAREEVSAMRQNEVVEAMHC